MTQTISIEQIRQWAHAQDITWDEPLLVAVLRRHKGWQSGGAWVMEDDAWAYFLGVLDSDALTRWRAILVSKWEGDVKMVGGVYRDDAAQCFHHEVAGVGLGGAVWCTVRRDYEVDLASWDVRDAVAGALLATPLGALLERVVRHARAQGPGHTITRDLRGAT